MGLAPTMSREVARASARQHVSDLLHTLGIVYLGISVLIVGLSVVAAPWIGHHWLDSKTLSSDTVIKAVLLMGLNLACRWPISLYQAALIGAHRLGLSSTVSIVINVSGAVIAIAILAYVSPSIEAFFLVQACMGLLHVVALRLLARKIVGLKGARFDLTGLKRIWRFSVGMSGISITSLAFTQLDKVLLSKLLDLTHFGYYMLAVLLAGGLQIFVSPAFNSAFPRFAALTESGQLAKLADDYSLGSTLLASALFPVSLTLAFHSHDIVAVWTGNGSLAAQVAPLVTLLAVGSTLNGVMHFPYALQIAFGKTRIPFGINLILLLILAPLTVFLALSHGAMGGAASWVIVEVIYTVLGTWWTGRKVMASAGFRWLFRDVGIPLLVSCLFVLIGVWMGDALGLRRLPRLGVAGTVALVACAACVIISPSSQNWARRVLSMTWTAGKAASRSLRH
jgi:O-antigen/teichoic acid export membrane protein